MQRRTEPRLGLWLGVTTLVTAILGVASCTNSSGPAPRSPAITPAATAPSAHFVDMTPSSGLNFTYRNGHEAEHCAILESLGGGVALLDYNQDGLLDIFVPGGGYFDGPDKKQIKGHPNRLYKNLGNWKFQDVTAEVGLPLSGEGLFYSHGCAVSDYNNDGWPDLLVTGWGRLALYRNNHGKFEEVTHSAGLDDKLWSTSAAWADFNGDGHPDLYVAHYVNWSFANHPPCKDYREGKVPDVCPPKQFTALPHILYLNNGDGTFRDASQEAGLRADGKGLGVVAADVNDDGKVDIYVANDTVENFLYLNKGGAKFEEAGLASAVACDDNGTPNGSMGVDVGDYDGSGALSIFVTNYQHESHALYRNRGNAQFVYASRSAGISAIGLTYVGFGTGFIDFDRDGAEDIFITNGHVVHYPPAPGEVKQRPILLRNLRKPGDKPHQVRFENVSAMAGPFFQGKYTGRGAAFGDLDNDGRTDVVISHLNEPVVLLRNALDNGHHWLGIELIGKEYRDAVGAKLTLESGNQKLVRTIKGGGSYLSASDRRVLFGLGVQQQPGRLTVRWPSGQVQTWDNLASDRYWQLVEGETAARPSRPGKGKDP
jgi:hypothetical protein